MSLQPISISNSLESFQKGDSFFSILLIRKSPVNFELNNEKICIPTNGLLLIHKIDQLKCLEKDSDSILFQINASLVNINFSYFYSKGIYFGILQNTLFLNIEKDEVYKEIWGTLSEIEKEYNNQLLDSAFMAEALINRLFVKIVRYSNLEEKGVDLIQVQHIKKFIELVERNYKVKHSLNEYSSILGVSEKTISNIFLKHTQTSPSKVVKERIIREAKLLISTGQKSGKELAYELGFADPFVFFKLFKKMTGKSFTEYSMNSIREKMTS